MKLVIAKVDQVFFDGEADSLTAPGSEGEMTVFQGHMPLVTTLKEGILTVRTKDREQQFGVLGGVMEVRRDGATVIL
jgi:F-type H+-transporting ATPase subunit epsilon